MSEAASHDARFIVLPVAWLGEEFFHLRTGIAGEVIQKFVTYGFRAAIVGDITAYLERSSALRDFVDESNKWQQVWFVESIKKLIERLERASRE